MQLCLLRRCQDGKNTFLTLIVAIFTGSIPLVLKTSFLTGKRQSSYLEDHQYKSIDSFALSSQYTALSPSIENFFFKQLSCFCLHWNTAYINEPFLDTAWMDEHSKELRHMFHYLLPRLVKPPASTYMNFFNHILHPEDTLLILNSLYTLLKWIHSSNDF